MSGSSSKMSVTQLTLLTALNMMGSGIIMLPTKLAEVGTFSIVSWLVTAGGSTALAYAFAKCGMLSRNRGGMGGYAEYAFGKSGSFLANYAYCVSLLIANIAIAISAVGYAVALFGLKTTPFETCLLTIVVLWICTVLNFKGAKITGLISNFTAWGVIIPVAGISVIGWFWFNPETYISAWNPHDLPTFDAISASISMIIREKRIDFFMSDSGLYAYEARTHGAKDIAVRTRPLAKDPSKASSSVVIVRADRHDLKVFEDLKGTTVVAESPKSFEGWLIIQAVLADKGFNPTNFWGKRLFTEYRSPNAAELVLAGEADVGILKACDFEQLLTSRNFRSSALRVIEAQKTDGLACLRSAPLYPNVVFASTSGGDPSFLKKLTMALLNQPPSHKGFSWGAAGDFVGVDQLYRSLKLGPYAYLRELNWQAVREEYLPHLLSFAGLIAALLIHSVYTKILVNVRTRQLRETLARQLDLEKEARISRTRLSQMERAGIVSQLSGMLAHEMLQPVTSILNFAGGLRMCVNQRFQEDPAICRASEAISEEAHRIAAIVERVRSYAKDEDSPRICLKASTALEAALKTFQHSSTSEEVRTRVVIKHNPLIEVNKLEIELVLFNLMKNSAAAMADAPSKQLDLSIDQQNNKVIFSIRDFGPQLSEAVFAHLTEPLTSMKKDGLGLGLSLAKAIVERHGGRISFTRLADGLCAEVILPTAATGLEDQTVLSTRQE